MPRSELHSDGLVESSAKGRREFGHDYTMPRDGRQEEQVKRVHEGGKKRAGRTAKRKSGRKLEDLMRGDD